MLRDEHEEEDGADLIATNPGRPNTQVPDIPALFSAFGCWSHSSLFSRVADLTPAIR